MSNVNQQILDISKSDHFLENLYKIYRQDNDNSKNAIVSLHNGGKIDLAKEVLSLVNENSNFFYAKNIFEKILPDLDISTQKTMSCVRHIFQEAGDDMSAGIVFSSFIEYCKKDENRVKDAIQIINDDIAWFGFIPSVIIAGSEFDFDKYVKTSIEFTKHKDTNICKGAVHSLGKLQYKNQLTLLKQSFKTIKNIIKTTNSEILSVSIGAIFALSNFDNTLEKETAELIKIALKNADDSVLYSVSCLCYEKEKLPIKLFSILLHALENVNSKHQGTIRNIDSGLQYLLENNQENIVIAYIEKVLMKNKELSIKVFDGLLRHFFDNKEILNKITTKWFFSNNLELHKAILEIIQSKEGSDICLFVDKAALKKYPQKRCLFAARKALGYLFVYPISAISFIVSFIDLLDKEGVKEVEEWLFDPLLISYSGKVKEYLESIKSKQSKKTQKIINALFKRLEEYHKNLENSWNILELKPSQEQQETYHRFYSRLMSKSMAESKKKSVFLSLVSETVILYGNQGISYHKNINQTKYNRSAINLQHFTTSMEFPSLYIIDSEQLTLLLFNLKMEEYKQ